MSVLLLVRHGQAGQMGEEYDQLSPLGQKQAAILGEYWGSRGETFDEVYVGTLKRQRLTQQIVGDAVRAAGVPWPEAQELPGLNEYSADDVMGQLVPELAGTSDEIGRLHKAHEDYVDHPEQLKNFQRLFEAIMRHWVKGHHAKPAFEPWTEFSARVRGALKHITAANGSGKRVAVFSSGGPIGVIVQTVLGAPDQAAMDINWRVRNCSLTDIVFSPTRTSLETFNTLPHITDEKHISLR